MKICSLVALALTLCALISANASAQVTTGTPPFASFGGGPDVVNLGNLNVHLDVPVRQKSGRGLDFTYDLTYDNSVWSPVTSTGVAAWTPVFNWGWAAQTQIETGFITYFKTTADCDTPPPIQTYSTFSKFVYHDAFGGIHPFSGSLVYDPTSCSGETKTSFAATATDGSGLLLNAALNGSPSPTTHTITMRNGQVTNPPVNLTTGYSGTSATATDRNGNQISVSSTTNTATYTDTTGASVLSVSGSATSTSPLVLSYTAPGGAASYTVSYKSYTVATKFGCSQGDYGPIVNNLVDTITLPDGSTYKFTYEATPTLPSDVTGRLASVKLPTGGTIEYTYTGGSSGHINCTDGSNSGLTRLTPDSTTAWNYARTAGTGAAYTTTVTDPTSNQTVIQFQGIYETQRKVYQGTTSGTLLQTTNTCYNTAASPCTGTAVVLPIYQRDVYFQLGSSGNAKHTTKYNSTYGMLTEQDDYDFGNSTTPLKKELITYASLSNGIVAAPYQVTVQDGSGNTKAQTTYTYDQGSLTTTGAPQHVAVSGSRGNATTIANLVQGSTTLTTTNTYDDTGNVRIATDVNAAPITYNYSNSIASCGFAFPTSVSEPLSMSRSFTWNCTGGVQTQLTDENTKATITKYTDADFWRPSEQDFPDGGKSTFSYGTNPTSVTTYQTMNASQTKQTEVIYDGLGRQVESQLSEGAGSTVSNVTTLDGLGRPYRVYNPTRCTTPTTNCSEATWGYTQYAYDALNRPTTITDPDSSASTAIYTNNTVAVTDEAGKKRTLKTDSIGRLAQVTEDPGGSGFVTTYGYDALDNITSVTDGSNSRTYAFDGLSRLTSESNPESGSVNYVYDTTTKGDLYSRTDARSVQTQYSFDALHRITMKYYLDGVTPIVYFHYDQTSAEGETPTNPAGHLTEIWTGASAVSYSWKMFSYDTTGRITTQWDCNSWAGPCPNVQTTSVSYDLTGNPTQIAYPSGLVVQQSFDTASRLCQVAPATSSCTPASTYWASNFTYDPASQLTGLTYGNGVIGTYGFSNRLQANSLKYIKGSSTLFNLAYAFGSGTTNNGQIAGITDAVDNGRSASYTYDSLNRLKTAVTTGSTNYPAWGLSWSYDQYGNRTAQTVTAGTAPSNSVSVNASNNRITTSGYGYDVSGNMTSDGVNTLTYDAEGRVLTATNGAQSGSYNYSGDGLRVHQVSGSTVTNSVYLGSNVIDQFDSQNGLTAEYVYLGGQKLAALGGSSEPNGGFEQGSLDWTLSSGNVQVITSATNSHSGNEYLQVSTPAGGWDYAINTQQISVSPGDHVDFGGWVYENSGTGGGNAEWLLAVLDSSHTGIAYIDSNPSSATLGAWTYQHMSYTIPSNGAYVYLYLQVYHPTTASVIRFDDGFLRTGTIYYHADQLSTRLLTNSVGTVIGQQGHFPYGESWYAQNSTTNWQFTSYQRDSESGNDYAMARSYVNRLARFSSPDPAAFTAANPSNPQSWNRYAYVTNSPLNFLDPQGLDPNDTGGALTSVKAPGCDGFLQLGPCMPSGPQLWLTITNFACWYFGTCQGGGGNSTSTGGGGGSATNTSGSSSTQRHCPSAATQAAAATVIASNPLLAGAAVQVLSLSALTGRVVTEGLSASAGASFKNSSSSFLPRLGGAAGATVGIIADPSGNLGIAISIRDGGGFGGGYNYGGSMTISNSNSLLQMSGSQLQPTFSVSVPVAPGAAGSFGYGLNGTVSASFGSGGGTFSMSGTFGKGYIIPLVCKG